MDGDSVVLPPPGYQRVNWVGCGHTADAPIEHDWSHRHWCPVDEPGRVDERDPCPGVRYVNVTQRPPVAVQPKCFTCGAAPARPYPAGLRCDEHSPAAARGRLAENDGTEL